MRKIVVYYLGLKDNVRIFIGSIFTAVSVYWSAFLSLWIKDIIKEQPYEIIFLHIIFIVIFLTSIYSLLRYLQKIQNEIELEKEKFRDAMLNSYAVCDRVVIRDMKAIDNFKSDENAYINWLMGSIESIQHIVELLYSFLESKYSQVMTNNEINFEVTFMTMSYNDRQLTIPAFYNKNGRAPHSMSLRTQHYDIYKNTVSAYMYRKTLAHTIIIEDTGDPSNEYSELYEDQKKRIKSTIVFPVLSDKNTLLGTLVAQCDEKSFFKKQDVSQWNRIMEIYSKKIAIEKVKLDIRYDAYKSGLSCNITNPIPF